MPLFGSQFLFFVDDNFSSSGLVVKSDVPIVGPRVRFAAGRLLPKIFAQSSFSDLVTGQK